MAEEVILQQPATKNYCLDMLDGVCVLQGAVEGFFNGGDFVHEQLASLLPCDGTLRVVNAETSIPENRAMPSIAMSRSDIIMQNKALYSEDRTSVVNPAMTLSFEIKTANYRTTEYMALELSQFLVTFTPFFRNYNLYLSTVTCGATKQFRDSTPNYFFAKVSVNAGVPLTKWQYESTDSILRSITLRLNVQGGDLASVEL